MCNIHIAGVPHCPWCVQRDPVLMAVPFLLIFIGQGGVVYYLHKKYDLAFPWLLLAGLIVFSILGALHGYVFKVIDGYPYFF